MFTFQWNFFGNVSAHFITSFRSVCTYKSIMYTIRDRPTKGWLKAAWLRRQLKYTGLLKQKLYRWSFFCIMSILFGINYKCPQANSYFNISFFLSKNWLARTILFTFFAAAEVSRKHAKSFCSVLEIVLCVCVYNFNGQEKHHFSNHDWSTWRVSKFKLNRCQLS